MLYQANKFIVELRPPTNPANLDKYFARCSHLIELTGRVSIASKPPETKISGFETSLNLARYLRSKLPNLDILFHLTCYDLNRVNIVARLSLLGHLNIVKILVLTGDDYDAHYSEEELRNSKWRNLFYRNSDELLVAIKEHYNEFAQTTAMKPILAVGGYPGGDGRRSHNNSEESERILCKVNDGANVVYTQCVFDHELFGQLKEELRLVSPKTELIPSIAMFQNSNDLERVANLTRVRGDSFDKLKGQLDCIEDPEDARNFSLRYLENLCRNLIASNHTIDLCTFGQFELAESLIRRVTHTQ